MLFNVYTFIVLTFFVEDALVIFGVELMVVCWGGVDVCGSVMMCTEGGLAAILRLSKYYRDST